MSEAKSDGAPSEHDFVDAPPLVVDADAPLSGAISVQSFEPVAEERADRQPSSPR